MRLLHDAADLSDDFDAEAVFKLTKLRYRYHCGRRDVGGLLLSGDVVVMDNLSSHKGPAVSAMIAAAGASVLYLPPYSPDFHPIEKAFSKLEAHLRKAAEGTVSGLWDAIGRLIDLFTRQECVKFFAAAGYDAT